MELRKDYLLDRWVLVAKNRAERPQEFQKPDLNQKDVCAFCSGNEGRTAREIGRVEHNGKWIIRWIENKYSAVDKMHHHSPKTNNVFFTSSKAYGHHEVIVETNKHNKNLWDFNDKEVNSLFSIYTNRMSLLTKETQVKYVSIFKNHGVYGGTSMKHSHSQILAYGMVPELVKQEIAAVKKFDNCPYCSILSIEKESDRLCFQNKHFVAFAPYASRFGYEVWVFPKSHRRTLLECSKQEMYGLSRIMVKILRKLKELKADYNFFMHNSPKGEDLHFHIEVTPRLGVWGAFEFATNTTINSVTPEDAALFYKK
jgi:UDPglucose--hexose-1-phosphate uridylyltransferase